MHRCIFFVDHGWEKPVFPEHVKRVDRNHHTGTNKSRACQVRNTGHNSCSSKGHFWWTGKMESFVFVFYSYPVNSDSIISNSLSLRTQNHFLGFQSVTIALFELPLFRTIFGAPLRVSPRKQPSSFAPGTSGATRAGSEEGRLFSQGTWEFQIVGFNCIVWYCQCGIDWTCWPKCLTWKARRW